MVGQYSAFTIGGAVKRLFYAVVSSRNQRKTRGSKKQNKQPNQKNNTKKVGPHGAGLAWGERMPGETTSPQWFSQEPTAEDSLPLDSRIM